MNDNHRQGIATESEIEKHLIIENPSSCGGQGFATYHADNPHYEAITKAGYYYSHSTPVNYQGTKYAHHTYKFPRTEWCVTVICRPGWSVSASKCGSGRHSTFFGTQVEKYLKRKSRELRAEAKRINSTPEPVEN